MNKDGIELIKKHEGLRLQPYKDTEGNWTWGYGTNLEPGITKNDLIYLLTYGPTKETAEYFLRNRIAIAEHDVLTYFGRMFVTSISKNRYNALVNMMFNLGRTRFYTFKKMIAALKNGDWERVADELLNSKYARQVGRRAEELAQMIREG
jgi:lysozyme